MYIYLVVDPDNYYLGHTIRSTVANLDLS